ncbi:flavodoxin family protein [Cetobacterium sp.]|uniref:flavodoxin family protein n=1 Tax=Cetobacterium sp. TaxID=2071632 RepID=UPI002FC6D2F1
MKVIAFNGSPKEKGNTYHALKMVGDELEKEGIEFEIIHVGNEIVRGCIACNGCAKNRNEECVLPGDKVNTWIQKLKNADGVLLGSPVHFASLGATMKAFLDRAFYVASVNGGMFRHKVGASVVAVRRSGGVPTFDQLNNYLNYSEMLMPTTNYWSVIHGLKPGEVEQDEEGKQILRVLGKNMAWLLKMIDYTKDTIIPPEKENKKYTHFIR